MASVLFGVEGLRVIEADAEADGSLTVWVVTDHPAAAACPDCGTRSSRVHEQVLAKIMDTLGADRHGQEILAAWIPKEFRSKHLPPPEPDRTSQERRILGTIIVVMPYRLSPFYSHVAPPLATNDERKP